MDLYKYNAAIAEADEKAAEALLTGCLLDYIAWSHLSVSLRMERAALRSLGLRSWSV